MARARSSRRREASAEAGEGAGEECLATVWESKEGGSLGTRATGWAWGSDVVPNPGPNPGEEVDTLATAARASSRASAAVSWVMRVEASFLRLFIA